MPRLGPRRDQATVPIVEEGGVATRRTGLPEPMQLPSNSAVLSPIADAERGDGSDGPSTQTLSRELADFLMDLAIAMHKHAIYPPGHPLLDQAVDSVHRSLTGLLFERPALSIGVARRQLIIEGVATDSGHPVLAELAGKLHRHHLGAVKFLSGLGRHELSDMLGVVGLEAQRDAEPLGFQHDLLQSRWERVKLFPLSYDRLELLDDVDPAEDAAGLNAMRNGHAAQLWIGLARAAIASELATRPEHDSVEPEAVAQAIEEHGREQAYDQVIVGYLLQIAHEVRNDGPREHGGLQRRISKLVGSLQPRTLERLLEMGGDAVQRRRFVLDAAQGMTVHAVVELVRAAASAEGATISHSLVRMLTKLATHASGDPSARSRAADGAFREHVERLVGSWSLSDPNPVAYSATLSQLSQANVSPADDTATAQYACEPSRLVGMALEIDTAGARVWSAVDQLLDRGSIGDLLDLLDAAPRPKGVVAAGVWSRIAERDLLRELLGATRPEHTVIRRLVTRIGADAVPPVLDALESCPEGGRQERLFSYLVQIGTPAAPAVAMRLPGAPPAIARELLICLGKIAPPVPPPEVQLCREHADPAVRREAVKLLLGYAATRETTLLASVRDRDERVAYCGILAATHGCPADAAAVIRQRIDLEELTDGTVRAAGIRAVATQPDEETLTWILRRTLVAGGLLRRTRLAPASPELLASLSALAAHWSADPRAAVAIALARESASPSVRASVHAR
jgi:hypothetical protein